ncbi:unnamed protein product [Durusdinium trenchii]|uniref:Pentatricopeptide repeat-containing protein, chloroplastic n=1 Tax=Durusdinium trenchii TaxID=1381693 RepID=A0ABP0M435_9DINO
MVAAIATEGAVVTSAEDSTAAPDTPNSSDVSVPISGASAPRRMSSGQSGRMCRVKEVQRATLERKEEVKDLHEKEGARSVPVCGRQAAVLVARPVEAVPNARGATGKSERRGSGVTASLRSGGGPARSNLARSPGPARSPTRSRPNSPEGRSGATGIKSPPRTRRKEQELLEQKALLERRIGEAQRSQVLLQRMLDEELLLRAESEGLPRLFDSLTRERRNELILQVLDALQGEDGARIAQTHRYTVGITACARAKLWQDALNLFACMPAARVEQDAVSLSAAVSSCEKSSQWQQALHLLAEMPLSSVDLTVASLNGAISSCAKGFQWQQALVLFHTMPKVQIQQDVISWNAALSSCEKCGQWQMALSLFQAMRRAQIRLDIISFSASISSCEKGRRWQETLSLFETMSSDSLQPDVISVNAGISSCEKAKRWQQAFGLLVFAQRLRLWLNLVSYNAAISACEKSNRWEQAFSLFLSMPSKQICWDSISWCSLLSSCEKAQRWSPALSALRFFRRLEPLSGGRSLADLLGFNAVISCYAAGRAWCGRNREGWSGPGRASMGLEDLATPENMGVQVLRKNLVETAMKRSCFRLCPFFIFCPFDRSEAF